MTASLPWTEYCTTAVDTRKEREKKKKERERRKGKIYNDPLSSDLGHLREISRRSKKNPYDMETRNRRPWNQPNTCCSSSQNYQKGKGNGDCLIKTIPPNRKCSPCALQESIIKELSHNREPKNNGRPHTFFSTIHVSYPMPISPLLILKLCIKEWAV